MQLKSGLQLKELVSFSLIQDLGIKNYKLCVRGGVFYVSPLVLVALLFVSVVYHIGTSKKF